MTEPPAAERPPWRAALPTPLLARARIARRGLEVASGARFETALALARAAPGAQWWVTDVDARVFEAPSPLHAAILDLHAPRGDWDGVDLVYAIRLPEELQPAAIRLASRLRADLALRPLKDEWAEFGPGRHVVWPDGWRFWPIE